MQRLSLASTPTAAPSPSGSQAAATTAEAQQWRSGVAALKLRAERVTEDASASQRGTQFRLTCELDAPIPAACLVHSEFLCLGWPLGGVWRIHSLDEDRRRLTCLAYRKSEGGTDDLAASGKSAVDVAAITGVGQETGLFGWQLQLGEWEKTKHWVIQELVRPLPASGADGEGQPARKNHGLTARLLAGFSPAEVRFAVNSITAVTTVEQTFEADVAWELTFPAITTIRDDGAVREFLDILEFSEAAFEFSNMHDTHSERPIVSKFVQAGRVSLEDATKDDGIAQPRVYHLQRSQRVTGLFKEQMSLYHFPFDQQKLGFTLNMSRGLGPILMVNPAPVDAGSFAAENFKLSNVFNVVYGDKVFVGSVSGTPSSKAVRFELVVERKSGYYLTNVALPAAIITYLSFITYAPVEGGGLMDLSSRLQIVSTLLLTCVTFKYNVASQIPQVSYFTLLDTYVFVCFVITCAITLENALFPLMVTHIGFLRTTNESPLLWISFGLFTIVNVTWSLYLFRWIKQRRRRAKVLLRVYEYARVMARAIPVSKRQSVLTEYLEKLSIPQSDLPLIATMSEGDLFVQLPNESSSQAKLMPADSEVSLFRKQALRDLPDIQELYRAREADEGVVLSPASSRVVKDSDVSPSAEKVSASPYRFVSTPTGVEKQGDQQQEGSEVCQSKESKSKQGSERLTSEIEPVVVVNVQEPEPSVEPDPKTQSTSA